MNHLDESDIKITKIVERKANRSKYTNEEQQALFYA